MRLKTEITLRVSLMTDKMLLGGGVGGGGQEWRSSESVHLPPLQLGFDSWPCPHVG